MGFFQAEGDLPKSPGSREEMHVLMVVSAVSLQNRLVSETGSSQITEEANLLLNSNAETKSRHCKKSLTSS